LLTSTLLLSSIPQSITLNIIPVQHTAIAFDFLLYENPIYGISLKYPGNWMERQEGLLRHEIVEFAPPLENPSQNFFEILSISIDVVPQNVTLNQYTNKTILDLRKFSAGSFVLISSNTTTLSTHRANKVVFTDVFTDTHGFMRKVKMMSIWTIYHDKVYTIEYFAEAAKFPTYLPSIDYMIDSFKIDEP
jgi:hypothetical protein